LSIASTSLIQQPRFEENKRKKDGEENFLSPHSSLLL